MKNGEILELYEALNRISQNKDLTFKIRVSYAMAKNKNLLAPEVKVIYELRRKILLEFGEAKENGDIVIPKENIDKANEKILELMNIENDIYINKVSIDMLDENELNIEDIEGLQYMIYIPRATELTIEK